MVTVAAVITVIPAVVIGAAGMPVFNMYWYGGPTITAGTPEHPTNGDAIEAIPQGLVLFDRDEHLALVNRRLASVDADLPPGDPP